MLELLEAVAADGARTQRHLASDLGVAVGLVNLYMKRCVSKGLVKVATVPTRRYAYYLTPKGFAEKSRLTVAYLSQSFSFFRRARADCAETFAEIKAASCERVVLAGASELAEVAVICALDEGVTVAAVVDAAATVDVLVGLPVSRSFDAVATPYQAVVVTDMRESAAAYAEACRCCGASRVFAPRLLGIGPPRERRP